MTTFHAEGPRVALLALTLPKRGGGGGGGGGHGGHGGGSVHDANSDPALPEDQSSLQLDEVYGYGFFYAHSIRSSTRQRADRGDILPAAGSSVASLSYAVRRVARTQASSYD